MDKIILTDADGVLLDWNSTFESWMADRGYKKKTSKHYELHLCYGIDPKLSYRLIKHFNESAAICQLSPYKDSKEWVKILYESGYKFRVISSFGTCKYAYQARLVNLKRIFGPAIDSLITCDIGAKKDSELLPYKDSGIYWIEDKLENAIYGKELGLRSILLSQEHNNHDTDITTVDSWEQIFRHITGV